MPGTWLSVLTELIPLALIIALSPLSIIPAVLVLHSPRPRPAGLAFLAGWLVGLGGLTALFIWVSSLFGGGLGSPPAWASWLRIVVGAALIVFGVIRWIGRHRNPHQPSWMRHITEAAPGRTAVIGAALTVVNPKVLFVCAAAGLAIGTAGLQVGSGLLGAWIWFVAASACTVALPTLGYAVFTDRLDPALSRLKAGMEKHNAALVAVILVVIGILVLYKGIHAL